MIFGKLNPEKSWHENLIYFSTSHVRCSYLCEFLKVQWLHFTGVVDKIITAYFQFFSGFTVPKIIAIGSFSTELLKTVIAFLKHGVYIRLCPRCCTWQITLNWQRSLALCETWRHPQNRKNITYRTAAREWPRYAHKQQAPKIWRGLNGWFLRYARRDM